MSATFRRTSLPVEGNAHQKLVAQVANHCALLFQLAGSDVSFPLNVLDQAAAGDSSKAGLLAAGMHARDLLASSAEGRKALSDLGFEQGDSLNLQLLVDSEQLQADLALLAQAADRSGKVRQLLLDAGDLAAQVRCVDVHDTAAGRADQRGVRLELADGLAQLVTAVRAGEFDDL